MGNKSSRVIITPNKDYYLTIPIINSGKNKILYIYTSIDNIATYTPVIQIYWKDNPKNLNMINNMIGNIPNKIDMTNKYIFYIPAKYINDNYINIKFNFNSTTTNNILIYELSTFDEFF